ncbi:hypothetical protein D3C85_1564210 [compost metagenome]
MDDLFCFDVIDLQDGVLAATAFHLDYFVTEDRTALPFPLGASLFLQSFPGILIHSLFIKLGKPKILNI